MTTISGRDIIAQAIDTKKLTALADSVANDGMQALLKVLKDRDIPGGLGDSRALRRSFRDQVHANIMTHALKLLQGVDDGRETE